jgi:hypothetical protein
VTPITNSCIRPGSRPKPLDCVCLGASAFLVSCSIFRSQHGDRLIIVYGRDHGQFPVLCCRRVIRRLRRARIISESHRYVMPTPRSMPVIFWLLLSQRCRYTHWPRS